MTDEEISMVLSTYMYLNYREADDGMTITEILSELSASLDYQEGGLFYGEYTILSEAATNPEIGELVIGNQSHLMGYDTGTAACTFSTKGGEGVYVVYRGTGDGEWPDNGLGMTQKSTLQQERALRYFEEVVEREHITENQKLIVTGHSKGGNKAQFVTMSTKYQEVLDACYNFDGQGFSEKAIEGWKNAYSEEEYLQRIHKITGIYGENDYVNVLGISIVPKNQIRYIKTPVSPENFAGYHDIKYMFATQETDPVTGETITVFHGRKNVYVENRGVLGNYAFYLSEQMMQMEEKERGSCAAVVMQLLELGGERKTGLNGEQLSFREVQDFFKSGLPMIAGSLFSTEEGWSVLMGIVGQNPYTEEMQGRIAVRVNYQLLKEQAEGLADMAASLKRYEDNVRMIQEQLPEFIKRSWFLAGRLTRERDSLAESRKKLIKLSEALIRIVKEYAKTDVQMAETVLVCSSTKEMV